VRLGDRRFSIPDRYVLPVDPVADAGAAQPREVAGAAQPREVAGAAQPREVARVLRLGGDCCGPGDSRSARRQSVRLRGDVAGSSYHG
jgi:hypothetical protein